MKIYRYTPGFLHAKSVMADREVALIGSTNMDYRTFQLHYECAVLLYHMPAVEDLLEDMDHDDGPEQRATPWRSGSGAPGTGGCLPLILQPGAPSGSDARSPIFI